MRTEEWSPNLRHLRAIGVTARLGSISAASEEVHLSQPALTQGIAKVERRLGALLFTRRPDGMAPTEAGQSLARRVDAALEQLRDSFPADSAGAETRISSAQMHAFLAFAAAGSFAGAAAASGIAQPTLHRAVTDLVRLYGLPLYQRVGRGVKLTPAGLQAARGMRRAAAELDAALSEIGQLAGREVGTIRIGSMPLGRSALIPAAIAAFRKSHPSVGLEIIDGTYADLADRLKDGAIDFLFGALRGESADPAFVEEPLFDDVLSIIARPAHPLAGGGTPDAADLARYPWIVARPDTPHHRHWERIFTQSNVAPPENPVICGSVMAIRELLDLGDYLALLSPDQVHRPVSVGHLVTLGPPVDATRRLIGLTVRADFMPTPLQRRMLELVRSVSARRRSEF